MYSSQSIVVFNQATRQARMCLAWYLVPVQIDYTSCTYEPTDRCTQHCNKKIKHLHFGMHDIHIYSNYAADKYQAPGTWHVVPGTWYLIYTTACSRLI